MSHLSCCGYSMLNVMTLIYFITGVRHEPYRKLTRTQFFSA